MAQTDFDWLQQWAGGLDANALNGWLLPHGERPPAQQRAARQVGVGSLLLLFAVEYARRSLPRDSHWAIPARVNFHPSARPVFFAGPQPAPALVAAFYAAARRLNLRRPTLGRTDDAATFNDLIAHQAGLTAAQLEAHFATWICGGVPPTAIQALLHTESGSREWQNLWRACQDFRHGEINAPALRQLLAVNPWVLPEWHDVLLGSLDQMRAPVRTAVTSNGHHAPDAPLVVPAISGATATGDIFGALTPFGGAKTVVKAARAVEQRTAALGLRHQAWSIAELRASDYDFIWLSVWVKRLEAHVVAGCARTKLRAQLGLLLWLWLSETARRHAVEGELWPHVSEGYFSEPTQELFFARGNPTPLLRELLRAAASGYHLRHVFEQPGVRAWIDTAFRQFGFTRDGIAARLPEWLDRQATSCAIQALRDPQVGSRSFGQLWCTLEEVRRAPHVTTEMRARLTDSPWILPEWIDDVIRSARAARNQARPAPAAPVNVAAGSFLTAPRLHWPEGGSPNFICDLITDLSALHLRADAYDVRVGGQWAAQLLRQADGRYLPAPLRSLLLGFDQPVVTVSLIDPQGALAASCAAELWPPDEDVAVYSLPDGERLPDAFTARLSPHAAYALLAASDLTIEPELDAWPARSRRVQLYRLSVPRPAALKLRLQDDVLWEPHLRATSALPLWARQLGVEVTGERIIKWGQPFHLSVGHDAAVTILSARCRGSLLTATPQAETSERRRAIISGAITWVGPLVFTPECDGHHLEVRLRLQKEGQRHTLLRRLEVNVSGAAHLHEGQWQTLDGQQVLTVAQARRDWFKLLPPSARDGQAVNTKDLLLFEGDGMWHTLPRGVGPLGQLSGWGAPLRVRALFNFQSGGATLALAKSVVDHGVMDEVSIASVPDSDARRLRVRLRERIEPTAQHTVYVWDATGRLIALPVREHDMAEEAWWWSCDLPAECGELLAVAVAYAGQRLGAWWPEPECVPDEGPEDGLDALPAWLQAVPCLLEQDAVTTATLLRWFHLPLLSKAARVVLRPLFAQHPAACLRAWLLDEGLPDELRWPTQEEAWPAVVRALCRAWRPDATTAQQTLLLLARCKDNEELSECLPAAAERLLRIDPLLLARVLRAWQAPGRRLAFAHLRLQLGGCDTPAALAQRQRQLLAEVQSAFDRSTDFGYFLNNAILKRAEAALAGKPLSESDKNNLAVAAHVPKLRLLVALDLLGKL